MKVAVIGAGPSGLACALELEKLGIYPDVYEQRHRPGEMFDHCAAVLEIFTRPLDPLGQLKDKFGLEIRPIQRIRAITMKSPNKKVTVRGNLGYFCMRGHDPSSVETQLYRMLKGPLITNTRAEYTDLARRYDYVVVANGSYDSARSEGIYSVILQTKMIGGTVLGSFDLNTLLMWIDTRYSTASYAYLCPMEKNRAFLGLVVNDSTVEEARQHWRLFWEIERHPYDQINEVIVEHNAGFVYPHQVGNLLFVGIAGGFQEPFLGFGMISSVKSGLLAARAIATGQNYEDLLVQLKEDMQHSLILRDLMNRADNRDFDRVMKVLSVPGVKQFTYNTNIDFVRIGTAAVGHVRNALQRLKRY